MKIAYHTRNRQSGVSYDYYDKPMQLARDVKILVVACPGGKETQRIVSREVIDALGKDGYLINVSRGSTVDEPALVDALVNGRLAGAGLDVFAAEPKVPEALLKLDNVVLQPHVSSGTHWTRSAMGQLVVDNLAAHFANKPLLTQGLIRLRRLLLTTRTRRSRRNTKKCEEIKGVLCAKVTISICDDCHPSETCLRPHPLPSQLNFAFLRVSS